MNNVRQTQWDAVSRFNIFASGVCAGVGVMYILGHGSSWWWLGIVVFAALTNWQAAHIKPPE